MAARGPCRILLVEDDYLHEDAITTELKEFIPGVQIHPVRSESDFLKSLDQIDRSDEPPPDLIILDYMIRWALPSPENDPPMPPESEDEGPFLAGTRCERRIGQSPKLARTPAIIFTICEKDVLKTQPLSRDLSSYLRKDNDLSELCRRARHLLDRPTVAAASRASR